MQSKCLERNEDTKDQKNDSKDIHGVKRKKF